MPFAEPYVTGETIRPPPAQSSALTAAPASSSQGPGPSMQGWQSACTPGSWMPYVNNNNMAMGFTQNLGYTLQSAMTAADTSGNIPLQQGNSNHAISLMTKSYGVASDSLPHIDLVSPVVRRDIIAGKDVNLAALLIPGHKSDSDFVNRHLVQGNDIITLKPLSDLRLKRNLTLSEFLTAFDIFKSVMCQTYHHRPNRARPVPTRHHRYGYKVRRPRVL